MADNSRHSIIEPMGSAPGTTRSGRPSILVVWVASVMVLMAGPVISSPLAGASPRAVGSTAVGVPAPSRLIAV
ncbi:MAG: hypothetical protein KDB26_14500, partial [Microthrixaceae bacterium]|nr:hypothetical protein [Microthrixaceae bacterium]